MFVRPPVELEATLVRMETGWEGQARTAGVDGHFVRAVAGEVHVLASGHS